ncbi:MAG: hypothetical protein IRZ29_08710, partial [Thermoflavifilum sp.]|nr:hypothetical protein [Thermoflavifilum sp.]
MFTEQKNIIFRGEIEKVHGYFFDVVVYFNVMYEKNDIEITGIALSIKNKLSGNLIRNVDQKALEKLKKSIMKCLDDDVMNIFDYRPNEMVIDSRTHIPD